MSDCCTVEWATDFATAHESEGANDDDKRMDLNNNNIGRRIYSAADSATATEAHASLLQYNLLWINSDTKNVTVGVDYHVYLEPKQNKISASKQGKNVVGLQLSTQGSISTSIEMHIGFEGYV